MKCPHCKKPMHVVNLKLGKGRTEYAMSPSLERKAKVASDHLASLIVWLREQDYTYENIGAVLGVHRERIVQYVKRARKDKKGPFRE